MGSAIESDIELNPVELHTPGLEALANLATDHRLRVLGIIPAKIVHPNNILGGDDHAWNRPYVQFEDTTILASNVPIYNSALEARVAAMTDAARRERIFREANFSGRMRYRRFSQVLIPAGMYAIEPIGKTATRRQLTLLPGVNLPEQLEESFVSPAEVRHSVKVYPDQYMAALALRDQVVSGGIKISGSAFKNARTKLRT